MFRKGPQDLPDSRPLLVFALALYALSDVLVLIASAFGQRAVSLEADLPAPGLLAGVALPMLVDMGLLGLCVAGVLYYTRLSNRLQRTLTALFGAEAILQFIAAPAFILLLIESLAEVWFILILLLMLILIWSISVYAHVLAQATARSFATCVALATLFFLLNYQAVQLIPSF